MEIGYFLPSLAALALSSVQPPQIVEADSTPLKAVRVGSRLRFEKSFEIPPHSGTIFFQYGNVYEATGVTRKDTWCEISVLSSPKDIVLPDEYSVEVTDVAKEAKNRPKIYTTTLKTTKDKNIRSLSCSSTYGDAWMVEVRLQTGGRLSIESKP